MHVRGGVNMGGGVRVGDECVLEGAHEEASWGSFGYGLVKKKGCERLGMGAYIRGCEFHGYGHGGWGCMCVAWVCYGLWVICEVGCGLGGYVHLRGVYVC